jgi:hypothetical protein
MLLLWLGTSALTASPQLHSLLHRDSNAPTHQCLVTQIQHYPLLSGLILVAAPARPVTAGELVRFADFHLLPFTDYRLSPSRAPPLEHPTTVVAG